MKYIKKICNYGNAYLSSMLFAAFFLFIGSADVSASITYPDEIDYKQQCSSGAGEVLVVKKSSDFREINKSTIRIICVTPGDYRGRGVITIMTSGAKSQPRYLVYYNPAHVNTGNHPVNQNKAYRAILSGLKFVSAKHWVVDGISFRPSLEKPRVLINFPAGSFSDSILLRNLLIDGGGGGAGQIYVGSTNNNISVVGSVLRNSMPVAGKDSHCIKINLATNIVIRKNEIYDCAGDGVQISHGGSPGTKIVDNDIYLTSALYSDCKGSLDPKGLCACAENAIDIKGATDASDLAPPSEWLTISKNRMWGFKRTDSLCGGTGDAGNAIVIHYDPSDYVMIKNNIIHNSSHAITVSTHSRGLSRDGTDHVSIINNTMYSIYDGNNKGTALNLGKALRYEVYFNTIVEVDRYLAMSKNPGEWNEFRCNVMVDAGYSAGEWHKSSIVDRNAYYTTTIIRSDKNNLFFPTAKSSNNSDLCFSQRRLTVAETFCVPHALTNNVSPHKNMCTAKNTILRPGIGVDNRTLGEYFFN